MKNILKLFIIFIILFVFIEHPLAFISSTNGIDITNDVNLYENNFLIKSNKIYPCGSAGPFIGMLLERWAKTIDSYFVYPKQYQDFEIIRQIITDKRNKINILTVDYNDSDYKSIQTAIDNANPGDAILVYGDIYKERLVISKPLWIIGMGGFLDEEKHGQPIIIWEYDTPAVLITSENTIFYGFKIKSNVGIELNTNNITIWGNTLDVNSSGIKIDYSRDSIITWNTITSNDTGIWLNHTYNLNITWNSIESLQDGIYVENSNNSILTRNTISNSTLYGLYIRENSDNNTITYNNFIENKKNAVCINTRNMWDRNYWSDYNGVDSNGDGIGDTPYSIYEDILDNHPLINLFTDKQPEKPRINPDEKGILCGKTNVDIPFYCIFDDPDDTMLYCKWLWGDNTSSGWLGPYGRDIPLEITNRWRSSGECIVTVIPVYTIVKDQYGRINISYPYETHIYDLNAIKNRLIRRFVDILMPTYFLSGWN